CFINTAPSEWRTGINQPGGSSYLSASSILIAVRNWLMPPATLPSATRISPSVIGITTPRIASQLLLPREASFGTSLARSRKNALCFARVGRVALSGICNRARGMMKSARKRHVVGVLIRLGQDFVPEPKAHHHFQRHRDEAFPLQS